jgi:chromosome segregation ATPase
MIRTAFLTFGLLLLSPAAPSQNVSSETATIEALLAEVRQLRQDLHIVAGAARRAQILIYRLHIQEGAVGRASQRLDDAKLTLERMEAQRGYAAAQIKSYEEMRDSADNALRRKQLDDAIFQLKSGLEASMAEQQELQAKEIGLEDELRTERAKLERLQDELDRLDKTLEASSASSDGKPK